MITREIEYFDGALRCLGYVAYEEENCPKPGLLIAPYWAGRDDFMKEKAHDMARLGYVAFALDLYGNAHIGLTTEERMQLMTPFMQDRGVLKRRLFAALKAISELPQVASQKIAIMGYCLGGLCALDLMRSGADICGAISIHGLLSPSGLPSMPMKGTALVLHGAEDPMVSQEEIQQFQKEFTQAGVDWEMSIYGHAKHAFSMPEANDLVLGAVYNARADARAKFRIEHFLSEIFSS